MLLAVTSEGLITYKTSDINSGRQRSSSRLHRARCDATVDTNAVVSIEFSYCLPSSSVPAQQRWRTKQLHSNRRVFRESWLSYNADILFPFIRLLLCCLELF